MISRFLRHEYVVVSLDDCRRQEIYSGSCGLNRGATRGALILLDTTISDSVHASTVVSLVERSVLTNKSGEEMVRAYLVVPLAGHHDLSKVTVVGDPQLLQKKIDAVRLAGPSKLQVIADFDGTLTKHFVNGRQWFCRHGILKQGNAEYDDKRQALYEYYHPLEFSPTIPIQEKTKLMEDWWGKTHNLLIEGGLTYDAIKESVSSSAIAFRDGVVELFEFLEERDILVLIFSAGLADIIEEVSFF
ncbi:hypothetical protein DKX38_019984 [Salix brachista]|uniref:5'-nucleotidase n=1 Tax=Salix brachista TaxID=2182728 RepID=A0A5N5KHQ1_9ROSI|nr:hypothetical protein DKX38_019984 [Salix brachista]